VWNRDSFFFLKGQGFSPALIVYNKKKEYIKIKKEDQFLRMDRKICDRMTLYTL